ncbi:MAG: hypothetical protein K0Q53_2880 [Massilibacillus sp.]|jgi:hypothetical protein|nr:hypothetical protein [Massilibacillus sp.]
MRRILGLVLLSLIMMPCLTPSSAEAKIKSDYNNFTNIRTSSSTYRDQWQPITVQQTASAVRVNKGNYL